MFENALKISEVIFETRPRSQKMHFYYILEMADVIEKNEDKINAIIQWNTLFEAYLYPVQNLEKTPAAQLALETILDKNKDDLAENEKYGGYELLDLNYLAYAYLQRGIQNYNANNYKEAINDYTQGIKIRLRLRDEGRLSNIYNLAVSYNNLGNSYEMTNKYEEAIKTHVEGLRIRKDLFVQQPDTQAKYFEVLNSLTRLVHKTAEDQDKTNNAVATLYDEFLYPMESLDKTEEAIKVLNEYFK
jgi:tetratricopeptide (TPR) repeat protein